MRKIGLLCLALVLALGALGVGFAAWTDELYIEGTVNTGDVDLTVEDYSGTWVVKWYPHGYGYFHGWLDEKPDVSSGEGEMVAWAEARPGVDAKADIVIEFKNIFPGQPFMADFLLHYDGSIPARLFADITPGGDDDEAILAPYVTIKVWKLVGYIPGEDDIHTFLIDANLVDIGVQVHKCDYILVKMIIELPQEDSLMGLEGSFEARIQAIQWNEYIGEWYYVPVL